MGCMKGRHGVTLRPGLSVSGVRDRLFKRWSDGDALGSDPNGSVRSKG